MNFLLAALLSFSVISKDEKKPAPKKNQKRYPI
jgi:hypothetical protein